MSRDVMLINTEIAQLVERMEPRHIALLMESIKNPDTPLITLSGELWPHLGYHRRRQIVQASNVTRIMALVKSRPFALAALMASKIAPVVVSTLFELSQTASKENVRATAAKELIRLAQSTHSRLQSSDDEPDPTDELDGMLESSVAELPAPEEKDEGPQMFTEDDLLAWRRT